MVKSLTPSEAQTLLAQAPTDVIDVREPDEWARGHLPGARNIPLATVLADPRGATARDTVLFVCARGVRSATAGAAVEAVGKATVYSLAGGTQAWESAGLAVATEAPTATHPAPARTPADNTPPDPPDGGVCGLPEQPLDAVVGENLRAIRTARGLSLDTVAQRSGLSRTVLGQIELGRTSPSVSAVWQLARAFDVPFTALLASPGRSTTHVQRAAQARRLVSADGRFASRALHDLSHPARAEFYELTLTGHSREDAQAHQPGTRENLIVVTGRLELAVGSDRVDLATGDAIEFTADVPHAYVNPGSETCRMYLVMTYVPAAG